MRFAFLCFGLFASVVITGCSTSRTSDTARTGLEQLLISNAIDQTLAKAAMPNVSGQKVFLDDQYLDCVDKGYVVASIRHRLLDQGALLVDAKENSDMTIEIRSGAIGTDDVSSFVGIPAVSVPGIMPIELPEVRVWERKRQFGTAKIGMVAYDSEQGNLVFDSGRPLARADDSRWSVLGVGPFQSGSVPREVRMATGQSGFAAQVAEQTGDQINRR